MIPRLAHVATSDGVGVPYQLFGEGPGRLVYLPRAAQSIAPIWDVPRYARFLSALGEMAEVLVVEVRTGTLTDPAGASDGSDPLGGRLIDVLAAMDGAGWESASILGVEDGGSLAALLAGTRPDRVERLVLFGAGARGTRADDYPMGTSEEEHEFFLDAVRSNDFTWEFFMEYGAQLLAPSHVDDEEFCRRLLTLYFSRASAVHVWEIQRDLDIRGALGQITAPTLVLDRGESELVDLDEGAYLADHIPGAVRVVVPGQDVEIFAGDPAPILAEVRAFLRSDRDAVTTSRVLSTVVFTDIVGSTTWASQHGDAAWRRLLERHDTIVRRVLTEFDGHEVDSAGDGFFATFDGPARAAQAALRLCYEVREHLGIELRAGVHTGEVELAGERVRGLAVHIGARVGALAGPSQVLATDTVKALTVGSGLTFTDAGTHSLKGVDEQWHLYEVGLTPR